MKKLFLSTVILATAQIAAAMPCDTGWSCKSKTGKYSVEVQRCRYSNSIGNLTYVNISGKNVEGAQLTSSYDSKSIGGNILAIEVSLPDGKNDAHYLAFEVAGKLGRVTERIQQSNPGPQKAIASESISCEETE